MTTTPDRSTPDVTPDQPAPVPGGAAGRPLRATTILGGAVTYLRANPGLALGVGLVGATLDAIVESVVRQGIGPAQQVPATMGTAGVTTIGFALLGGLLASTCSACPPHQRRGDAGQRARGHGLTEPGLPAPHVAALLAHRHRRTTPMTLVTPTGPPWRRSPFRDEQDPTVHPSGLVDR